MTVELSPSDRWDVFMAHASEDKATADALAVGLRSRFGLTCFLDADSIGAGRAWPTKLKRALAQSRVIAILVSEHSDAAFYLQEEVAIAVRLLRSNPEAVRVVPILLRGTRVDDMPYGTSILEFLSEQGVGLGGIAAGLDEIVRTLPDRGPGTSLGRATESVDEMWVRTERAVSDSAWSVPPQHRLQFHPEGEDLVASFNEAPNTQRVTRDELESRLTGDQVAHIAVLERSMEVNKAIWDERYPKRLLDKRNRRKAEEALAAMKGDLDDVLEMIESSGLWLDDHYLSIRAALQRVGGA